VVQFTVPIGGRFALGKANSRRGLENRLRFKHSDGKACDGTASAAKLAAGNGCRAREAPLMWNVSAGLAYSEKPYFS
jgi:hypothetical protein